MADALSAALQLPAWARARASELATQEAVDEAATGRRHALYAEVLFAALLQDADEHSASHPDIPQQRAG